MFDLLVAEGLLEGKSMAAIAKPRLAWSALKAIRAACATGLTHVASVPIETARHRHWSAG